MSLTIKLPKGKTIPQTLRTKTDEELLEILELGNAAWDIVQTKRSDDIAQREIAALKQQNEEEITKLRAESKAKEEEFLTRFTKRYDDDIAQLKSEAEKERKAAQERILEIQLSRDRVLSENSLNKDKELAALSLKYNIEIAKINGQLSEVQSRKQVLEQEFATNVTRAVQQEKESSERFIQAKQAELIRTLEERDKERSMYQNQMCTITEKYDNQITTLTEKIQELTDKLSRKPTSMKEKGTAFELLIIEYMKQYWGTMDGFAIRHEATTGHKGDIWMDLGQGERFQTILVESKDYSGTLPTKEITKFFKDVKTNHAVKIGILLVKDADITGYNTHGDIEFAILEGKLHLFVNYFERFEIHTIMNILMGWIRYWEQIQKPATDVEDKAEAIRIIQKLVEQAQKYNAKLVTHIHHMNDMCTDLNQHAKDTHMALQEALRGLQHGVGDNVITDSALFEDATGNPKKQERIRVIQDITEEEADSVILLADLAKRFSERAKCAEKTAKEHIESVIKLDYIERKSGAATKVRGLKLKPD